MNLKLFTLTLALAFLWMIPFGAAQEGPTVYFIVDYMKVKPGMEQDYVNLEKAWKKIHAATVQSGQSDGWYLEQVVSPYGTQTEYNYCTIRRYIGKTKFAKSMDNSIFPSDWKSRLTPEEVELVGRTTEIREMVKQEVFSQAEGAFPEDWNHPKVRIANYMKCKPGVSMSDYINVEASIWKPVHKVMLEKGKREGWGMYVLELPYGTEMPYDAITVDFYNSMEQYMNSQLMDIFESVHVGKKTDDLFAKTSASRDLLRSEVSILIDFVDDSNIASAAK